MKHDIDIYALEEWWQTAQQNIQRSFLRIRLARPCAILPSGKVKFFLGWRLWYRQIIKFNPFSGGAVITNPPLNQNKTEGDLVNFSCEGEVTKSSHWKNFKSDKKCGDGWKFFQNQGTPGNLTISWYRDNIPIRSVSSMQVININMYVIGSSSQIPQNLPKVFSKLPKIPPQNPKNSTTISLMQVTLWN